MQRQDLYQRVQCLLSFQGNQTSTLYKSMLATIIYSPLKKFIDRI